ncbi:ABC transporter permease [Methanobrevibacter sp. DSM 116169]|uniref:ABC transporter permease n=1 Tax=Methanobrevibacter sp. DSM 116169 TaxID=3242727 RepID=UPI0038FC43A8
MKNPFRNKTRSALSIVGIAIGIATIVALGLITGGMEASVQTTINEGSAEITVSEANSQGMGSYGHLNESYLDEIANMNGVNDTAGLLSVTGASSASQNNEGGFPNQGLSVYGLEKDDLYMVGISSINGSYYEDGSNKAIIGKMLAESENKTIGDTITISDEEFEITGIFETGSMMTDNGAYVSLSKLQNITDSDYVSSILVKTGEGENDTLISDNIEDKYEDELSTITSEEQMAMLESMINILDTASLAISALAIIVGGIGIINTMIMSVYERTKEIGVLKAVGWKSKRILGMILGETIVLTLVSAVVGIIFGILVSEIGIGLFAVGTDFSLGYNLTTFLRAFGVAILVGIIGGIYPAHRASKLPPTEALRYE